MSDAMNNPPAGSHGQPEHKDVNLIPRSSLNESFWSSLTGNLRAALFPEQLPPLHLTSKPIEDDSLILPKTEIEKSLWASLTDNLRAIVSPENLPPLQLTSKPVDDDSLVRPLLGAEKSLWQSLSENVRGVVSPEKLPPLQVTSKPIRVRSIWGDYDYKREGASVSMAIHVVMVAGLIGLSIMGARAVKHAAPQQESVTLIAPDAPLLPISTKKNDRIGGGGGGGDRDKLEAPKGKLPKLSMEQLAPPAVVIRNDNPKLAVEPTIVIPPQIKMSSNLPDLGNPMSAIPPGQLSNGTGSGGGIGSGSGGGVGSGTGPGFGPGHGGGMGGGAFHVGGGVSAPRALQTPDPEYSEEARKAKYQGTVILWLIVGQDGRPRDIRVSRPLGMGLDEKAIEAVRNWRFEPALKDGKPVAVQINVEVNFRLY